MISNVTESEARLFGPHRVVFEPPDMACVIWNGPLLPEHMRELYELADKAMTEERFFVIADLTALLGIPAGSRKEATQNPIAARIAAIALVGGSFHIRVLTTMLGKAMSVFYPDNPMNFAFHASEEEARAWIDSLRRKPQE